MIKKIITPFVFCVVIAILLSLPHTVKAKEAHPLLGQKMPPIFKAMEGKPAVVHFQASWCPYCRQQHALVKKMVKDVKVDFYAVAYKDSEEKIGKFFKQHGNPYKQNKVDTDNSLGKAWKVKLLPSTYVVDRDGIVRYALTGMISDDEYQKTLRPLLKSLE